MILKAAVIGVGSMGRNHARVYSEMSDIQLVGVADPNKDLAADVSSRYGGEVYSDYVLLLNELRPDIVTIAVPTSKHLEVAREAIARGIHLLVEKPIAATVEEGRQIIHLAAAANVQLMVGHIERFNPAVVALKEHLDRDELGRIFQMDARRQGPFPAHVRDVGVVIDLAVHDVDVMRYVSGSDVQRVYAETGRLIRSNNEDMLCGLLRMENGAVGTLTINWLTPTKIREFHVIGEKGMFRVNYMAQDLVFYENATVQEYTDWGQLVLRGVSEGAMYRPVIARKEPLRTELESFVRAVRGESGIPVSGEDGLKALAIAKALIQSSEEQCSVDVGHLKAQE